LKAEALRESLRQTKAERDKKYAMECLSKEERRKRMDEERRESLQKAREAAEKRRQEEKEKYEKLGGVSKKKKLKKKCAKIFQMRGKFCVIRHAFARI
jgi:hypothetical protein